ncbi:RING-H2 finger protein ATL47 [Beta vulgaris subsp. vulgaris]|uniref:RING-H2 finger protein ATL47 n=1 Tax=Beta vulgaris subsp. vulgaris TaxID=3555 RepID=UPI0020375280|nr:RING-H2 finger protein ATL47 [Beta vulgaris subsp. vulgaris]
MYKLAIQFKQSGNFMISPPPTISPPPFPAPSTRNTSPSSSSSGSKISPVVLLIIVILAMIFFIAGILHLLIRYLMKRPSFSIFPSNSRNSDNSNNNTTSEALQRQLQQLFRLHDSGLDQALIDALPVFYYKDVMGMKEPFDCAVCLCEFCEQDKLRLLPLCSHAFHISCIDTWLLSNSTCPLCRGSLLGYSGLENQEFSLDFWRALSFGRSVVDCESSFRIGHSFNSNHLNYNKPTIMEENAGERRVFSVRLGKFRSVDDRGEKGESIKEHESGDSSVGDDGGGGGGGGSSSQLDARRCYSLGSYQYVLADSNLQVALSPNSGDSGVSGGETKIDKMMGQLNGDCLVDGDIEGKKISRRNRRESFSVSKIWLWSKKGKLQGSSETNFHVNGGPPPLNVVLPLSTRDHVLD